MKLSHVMSVLLLLSVLFALTSCFLSIPELAGQATGTISIIIGNTSSSTTSYTGGGGGGGGGGGSTATLSSMTQSTTITTSTTNLPEFYSEPILTIVTIAIVFLVFRGRSCCVKPRTNR